MSGMAWKTVISRGYTVSFLPLPSDSFFFLHCQVVLSPDPQPVISGRGTKPASLNHGLRTFFTKVGKVSKHLITYLWACGYGPEMVWEVELATEAQRTTPLFFLQLWSSWLGQPQR